MKMIEAGTYTGHAVDWKLDKSLQKGTPYVQVTFEVRDNENVIHKVRWTGFLTDKTKARTIKALVLCGLKGNDLADMQLDPNEDVSLVVEVETTERGTFPKVKWVNQAGGGKFKKLAQSETKALLKGIDVKAEILAARAELGMGAAPKAEDDSDSDLPF